MSKGIRWSILAFLLMAFCGFIARANTISIPNGVITSGSATRGQGAFSGGVSGLNFGVSGNGSSYSMYMECYWSACLAPGSYRMLDGFLASLEYLHGDSGGGSFVKDGISYGCGAPSRNCDAGIMISYTLNLPDPGPSPPYEMVLTVPLSVNAAFGGYDDQGNSFYLQATGVGKATLTLNHAFDDYYFLRGAQYEFFAVPEPATMTLAGLGLLAVILVRRRVRRVSQHSASGDFRDYR